MNTNEKENLLKILEKRNGLSLAINDVFIFYAEYEVKGEGFLEHIKFYDSENSLTAIVYLEDIHMYSDTFENVWRKEVIE